MSLSQYSMHFGGIGVIMVFLAPWSSLATWAALARAPGEGFLVEAAVRWDLRLLLQPGCGGEITEQP